MSFCFVYTSLTYVHVLLMKDLCIKPFKSFALYTCGASWSDMIVVSSLLNIEDMGKCLYEFLTRDAELYFIRASFLCDAFGES